MHSYYSPYNCRHVGHNPLILLHKLASNGRENDKLTLTNTTSQSHEPEPLNHSGGDLLNRRFCVYGKQAIVTLPASVIRLIITPEGEGEGEGRSHPAHSLLSERPERLVIALYLDNDVKVKGRNPELKHVNL
ncbi:hypothetical protein E2C01_070595 [Portunus trituberculatus]|uniref:Uncharacterized protein n=1 Tax=Portunus trituberculatus TaxID=210409 RepID=A0A5B7I2Q1_PORTR|nr:hypothetical protein [Portunus trituberculatus]